MVASITLVNTGCDGLDRERMRRGLPAAIRRATSAIAALCPVRAVCAENSVVRSLSTSLLSLRVSALSSSAVAISDNAAGSPARLINPAKMTDVQTPSFPQAQQLLAKGKSLLANSDFEGAVQAIGEALQIATKVKGELDNDLADFYYANGNALLCRYEQTVQDEILPTDPVQAALQADSATPAEDSAPDQEEESKEEEGAPEEEEDDCDELQLAWENLETARIIYVNFPSGDELIKVHVRLGDLQVVREDYPAAIEEYTKALNLLDAETPSRKLAEVHFLLGTTNLAQPGNEEAAIQFFDKAISALQSVGGEDIEELVKEIKEKKEDALEQAQSYKVIKESVLAMAGDVFSPPQNPSGPVVDLGVVKRKREDHDNDSKKPKPDSP